MLGEQVGTAEARDLAIELQTWHDSMVMHARGAGRRGACPEGCPHEQAQILWAMALDVFGALAGTLSFLRTHGSAPVGRTIEGRAARLGP